jgi:hypothetical protein
LEVEGGEKCGGEKCGGEKWRRGEVEGRAGDNGSPNGGTKPTKETDPFPERLFNSTRARFAREGGRRRVEF